MPAQAKADPRSRPAAAPWIAGGLAAGAALVAALVSRAYARDLRAARARLEGRSSVVESPFGPIEYATAGEGPAVLGIHGAGGGFDQGLEMMGPLVGRGYRLIAPSRFGYLRSARPDDASPEMQADAFAWLVSHLGEEKVIVAAGSAGALSALQFAIRHPDKTRAVVVVVPAAYAPDRKPDARPMGRSPAQSLVVRALASDFLFWAGSRLFPQAMTRAVLATDPALVKAAGAAEQARVRAVLDHILPVSRRALGLADDGRWAGAPPRYALERIKVPLLAISDRDDLYDTYPAAEYTAGQVPNGLFAGFPTGGHLWVGHDHALWDAVGTFLEGLPGEPTRRGRGQPGRTSASR